MATSKKAAPERIWSDELQKLARDDGWQLIDTVDSGKRKVYLHPFPHGPRHKDSYAISQHLVACAQTGSKIHIRALQCIAQTRMAAR